MRSITHLTPQKTEAINLAKVDTTVRSRICVIGWSRNNSIPDEYSDWLTFLLIHHILDQADYELEEGDTLSVRYNLAALQAERTNIIPLLSYYPQIITIQKVGNFGDGCFNIWVDDKLTSLVRNGYAYGKKIYSKAYDRCAYNVSRILATKDDDIFAVMNRFPHSSHNYFLV